MAKLADLAVIAYNKDNRSIFHEAKYACSVSSDGVFSAELPSTIIPSIQALSNEMRGTHYTTMGMKKNGAVTLESKTLASLRLVLHAYSASMVEASVVSELRIFYKLELAAPYYKTAAGTIYPNGRFVSDYDNDKGKWHGERRSSSWDATKGSVVGVGARISLEKCITPSGGEPAWSYDSVDDEQLGEHGLYLNAWTGQPSPRDNRGERTKLASIPYTEEAAKMFSDVLLRLSIISDQLETHLSDADALPALIASGGTALLEGPK